MPKIKGWKKFNENIWVNNETKHEIFIDSWNLGHGEKPSYEVVLQKVRGGDDRLIGGFNNFNKAKKFAVQWMREHPNGKY